MFHLAERLEVLRDSEHKSTSVLWFLLIRNQKYMKRNVFVNEEQLLRSVLTIPFLRGTVRMLTSARGKMISQCKQLEEHSGVPLVQVDKKEQRQRNNLHVIQ